MKFITHLALFIFLLTQTNLIQANNCFAAVNLRIDNKEIPKVKILFGSTSKNNLQAKLDIEEILNKVKRNLQTTDLFTIVQRANITAVAAATNDDFSIEKVPDFIKYSNAGVGMLLVVDANFSQAGDLEIKVRLWDVLDERQLFGKFYASNRGNYKTMANLIADEIFKAATGEKAGHFNSKIAYIAESGNASRRMKRIVTMDFDGEDFRYLTNGRDLVLTPIFAKGQFSQGQDEILFVRFFAQKPQIYSLDTNNALVRKVGSFRGTTFAPTINPKDSDIIAFSVIDDGNSNIYQMNLYTNQNTRLTSTRAIDTTPSYSPDGKYIAFSSDRSGGEQIYVMNNEGRDVRKITSGNATYSKPVWSPDGKFIAFTKIQSNQFSIGVIDVDGRNEKTITRGYLVEGAKWSPNSRYLIYSKKDSDYGKASIPKLYIVDVLTGYERKLPTPENEGATDPDWVLS
jgi:TolB protein